MFSQQQIDAPFVVAYLHAGAMLSNTDKHSTASGDNSMSAFLHIA